MREILFRGKRVDNGEWVEGCYAEFVHGFDGYTKPGIQVTRCVPSVANRLTPTYETELVEVFPETVGQYTGLTDKNGNKIFEGDRISFVDFLNGWETECIGEVIFSEYGWHFTNSITESNISCYESEHCEIIGNIHDEGAEDAD